MRARTVAFLACLLLAAPALAGTPPVFDEMLRQGEDWTKQFETFAAKGAKNWNDPPFGSASEIRKMIKEELAAFPAKCKAESNDPEIVGPAVIGRSKEASKLLQSCKAVAAKDWEGKACGALLRWSLEAAKGFGEGFPRGQEGPLRFERECRYLIARFSWSKAAIDGRPEEARSWCEKAKWPESVPAEPWKTVCAKYAEGASAEEICALAVPIVPRDEEPDFPETCLNWVSEVRGDRKLKCAGPKVQHTDGPQCLIGWAYAQASKSGNPADCGGHPFCRLFLGADASVCEVYFDEMKAAYCKLQGEEMARFAKAREKALLVERRHSKDAYLQRVAEEFFKEDIAALLGQAEGKTLSKDHAERLEALARVARGQPDPPNRRGIIMNIMAVRQALLTEHFKRLDEFLLGVNEPRELQHRVTELRERMQDAAKAFSKKTR